MTLRNKTIFRKFLHSKVLKSLPHKYILIAGFPKSGSTYLYTLLKTLTSFRGRNLTQFYGDAEQDLYKCKLEKYAWKHTIVKQHVKGGRTNVGLMKEFNIKPIVHTRNIFDVVVSLKDHLKKEDRLMPTGYVHEEYFNMSTEDKLMYLIKIHIPWYLNFLVSWDEASEKISTLWTSYEKLFANQAKTVFKILDFYGLSYSIQEIDMAISKIKPQDTRFNVGVRGRGQSLTGTHKEAIIDIAKAWKINDSLFEKIGLCI